jgi:hypothetical protein
MASSLLVNSVSYAINGAEAVAIILLLNRAYSILASLSCHAILDNLVVGIVGSCTIAVGSVAVPLAINIAAIAVIRAPIIARILLLVASRALALPVSRIVA